MGSRAIFNEKSVTATKWFLFDGKYKIVGKLAAHVAKIIAGKHKPIFNPAVECGDNVVVINAKDVMLTGKKYKQKHYRWHTGYPGGLVVYPVSRMFERHPERVLWKAVYGMLPKNRLRRLRMQRLKLFADDKHPYGALLSPVPSLLAKPHSSGAGSRRYLGHLRIASTIVTRPTSEEEVKDIPGFWIKFENTPEGVWMESHEQIVDGKRAPRINKGKGIYLKGTTGNDRATIIPMDQIPALKDVAHLSNTFASDDDTDTAEKQ